MADTLYAWSTFRVDQDQWGNARRVIKPGDQITQADLKSLGVGDAEWESLVKGGAVRTTPYPNIPENVAPAEHLRALAASNDVSKLLELAMTMAPNIEPGTLAEAETQRVQTEQQKSATEPKK